MDCVSCDHDNDFNRVAVDRPSGEITGAVCVRCEMDLVSRSTDSTVLTMATCLICGGDSEVLFPEWDSIVETDDGRRKIEYTVELTTPALCDGCLAVNELTRPVQAAEEVGVD